MSPVSRAAAWMAGWLLLMVVIAVAGREAMRELTVFQVMLMSSLMGLAMLAVQSAIGLVPAPLVWRWAWR